MAYISLVVKNKPFKVKYSDPVCQSSQRHACFRLFVTVLVVISVAWIPLIVGSQRGQLFIYIQAVTGYVAPPICSIFLLAMLVPRVNETVTVSSVELALHG